MPMEKQTIVLGVSGGIAAFKAAQLTSNLIKKGYDVEVIMTQNATEFITPLTFESLTKHNVMVSTFEKVADRSVKHISIAQRADVFAIVPATANVIAKIAHGLADDMLTTTFLACSSAKVICPAMNTGMYENPLTQQNIAILRQFKMDVVEPGVGMLACGDLGKGRLADLADIEDAIEQALHKEKPLLGKHVLISAGPTQEALDPVRYISNHSTGKMGYALAFCAKALGAQVTLVSGPSHEHVPYGVHKIDVQSAQEMFDVFQTIYQKADIIIKSAAVGDYRAQQIETEKIKKQVDSLNIAFIKNQDILGWLGQHKKPHQILCGFAMETENLESNAKQKLKHKNCDLLVANNLKVEGAGFQKDTNVVTIFTQEESTSLPCMSKRDVAYEILKKAIEKMTNKGEGTC